MKDLCLLVIEPNLVGRFIRPSSEHQKRHHPIYPTPPLGQDMTQGQFSSGV